MFQSVDATGTLATTLSCASPVWKQRHGDVRGGVDKQTTQGGVRSREQAFGVAPPLVEQMQTMGELNQVYQPFNSASIRSRMDSYITKVTVREGQPMNAGELLVQIDPLPYEASLEQARSQLVCDLAVLANAQRDLARYAPRVQQGFTPRQTYDTQRSPGERTQTAIWTARGSASLHQPPSELQSTSAGAR